MRHLQDLSTWTALRLRMIRTDVRTDRGEGPVTTAIIVTLLAILAVVVAGVIATVAGDWTGRLEDVEAPP